MLSVKGLKGIKTDGILTKEKLVSYIEIKSL